MDLNLIRDHATNPNNFGPLPGTNAWGESHYHKCGDSFRLLLHIEQDTIQEAHFTGRACSPVVAMGSLGTRLLQGLTLEQARALNAFELDALLGGLPAHKRHAILLFLDSLHQALTNHQIKEKDHA